MAWATEQETRERFHGETVPHAPAEPGDTRFEYFECVDGMEETPYGTHLIDDRGEVVETHFFVSAWERSEMLVAFREAQERRAQADRLGVHPLEIEFAPFGPAWQREQEGRQS